MSFRRLWLAFTAVVVVSFAVLGWTGIRIYQQAPPVPEYVVTSDGRELISPGQIHAGQNVWQSMGGQPGWLPWPTRSSRPRRRPSGGSMSSVSRW